MDYFDENDFMIKNEENFLKNRKIVKFLNDVKKKFQQISKPFKNYSPVEKYKKEKLDIGRKN